ncbi:MAG: acetyl-CoA carboxylase biotin carboxyl carrier protein subunit [Marinilabiliales bacterium]|nr:MAG: acetyl-CoA carboxylase biotin carboxyl carrier protein subunit [Marinilabiliales bacterium]
MYKFKFKIRGNNYDVDVKKMEGNIAKIEVNGSCYEVELQKEATASKTPILKRSSVKHPEGSDKIKRVAEGQFKVKAPLPGNILQIFAKEGDEVKKGDKLLQYEAMKMENDMLSEKDGIISKIKVAVGDSVLQDDELMILELK